jgi:hypothetical protein
MCLLRYELGFISQKTTFFIVTAVKTSNLYYTEEKMSAAQRGKETIKRQVYTKRYRRKMK